MMTMVTDRSEFSPFVPRPAHPRPTMIPFTGVYTSVQYFPPGGRQDLRLALTDPVWPKW